MHPTSRLFSRGLAIRYFHRPIVQNSIVFTKISTSFGQPCTISKRWLSDSNKLEDQHTDAVKGADDADSTTVLTGTPDQLEPERSPRYSIEESTLSEVVNNPRRHVLDKGYVSLKRDLIDGDSWPMYFQNDKLHVRSPGFDRDMVVPSIWLRDHCQCSSCVHSVTKQRLLDTFKIPADITISEHQFKDQGKSIDITWSDGHQSTYNASFVALAARPPEDKGQVRLGLRYTKFWDSSIAKNPPEMDYPTYMEEGHSNPRIVLGSDGSKHHHARGLGEALNHIRRYGFCIIRSAAPNPKVTKRVLNRIAFIRETHYGGFYDFTADLASADTAYTNIALEAHTDNTYFSDPAGLQAFHCISHTQGTGGESLLVDGFKVANDLKKHHRDAYEVLSTVNVHAHASGNEDVSIQPYRGFPVLNHDPQTGKLVQIRWNNSDRSGLDVPLEDAERWYDAARQWDAMLKDKENEYWLKLRPDQVLIFDNWRVLHGRAAFTGKRRIAGGYINRDDWISKYKMTNIGREKILEDVHVD